MVGCYNSAPGVRFHLDSSDGGVEGDGMTYKCFMCGFARETPDDFLKSREPKCPKCKSRMVGEEEEEDDETGFAS